MIHSTLHSSLYSILFFVYLSYNFTTAIHLPLKRSDQDFTLCDPEAICGTVQMTSRGFTATPMCTCPDPSDECPLVWDLMDKRSVKQGSIQYKHCKGVSPRRLNVCMPEETAYAMRIITPFELDEDDGSMMKISHKIYCTCPENYQHTQQGEDVESVPSVGEIKTYTLSCAPFPICEPDQSCKTLSESRKQFLENEVCRCGSGTHCPVSGNRRAKSFDFGLGKITQLYCQ